MPNRDVTVTAFFNYAGRWRDDRLDPWRFTIPPAGLPTTSQPSTGAQLQNDPIANTASFVIELPGVRDGYYRLSITNLPPGVTAPATARVTNNELHLQLSGITDSATGARPMLLVLYDARGNAVTVPILFTLRTANSPGSLAQLSIEQVRMRLYADTPVFSINGFTRTAEAATFVDQNNRPMVPLRLVAENLGIQVNWVPGNQAVILRRDGQAFTVAINEPLPGDMGTVAVVDGRTFIPLEFASQVLGANTHWDGVNRVAYVLQIPAI